MSDHIRRDWRQWGVGRVAAAALLAACLLAVSAACATDTDSAGTSAPTEGMTTAPAPAGSTPVEDPAEDSATSDGATAVPPSLDFAAGTVAGGHFDGATLAGKPAVLWFWAAWCPRCRAKAPDIRVVQAEYAGKVNFLGVAGLGSGAEAMAGFVDQYDLGGFTHLADDQGTVWGHFGVTEQEYFVLLDSSGTVVHRGPLSIADLRDQIATLT